MKTKRDVKIAGTLTVADWEDRKKKLRIGEMGGWKEAYGEFFRGRIDARYFEPIKLLIENGKNEGEGFSIVALQCSLIEFLASTLEGKSYRHIPCDAKNAELREHEYGNSSRIFTKFLQGEAPFNKYFRSGNQSDDFYRNVRCALLHEARTKGGWRILAGNGNSPPIDVKEKIVYRNSLQSAFNCFVDWYGNKLPYCEKLQRAFIRKFDSLCCD